MCGRMNNKGFETVVAVIILFILISTFFSPVTATIAKESISVKNVIINPNKKLLIDAKESLDEKNSDQSNYSPKPVENGDFGVWIHTEYNGVSDATKLDIDLEQFRLMLNGGGWVPYTLSMEKPSDTTVNLRFVRTKIFLEDGTDVDVIQTQFSVDTKSDTLEDFEISLEVRFPFSLLKKKNKEYNPFSDSPDKEKIINTLKRINEIIHCAFLENLYEKIISFSQKNSNAELSSSESYFCVRIGYSSPDNDEGPNRVDTRFFFGRNSIWDPQVFRMKITPYDLGREFKLSYFNSYLTVDESNNEAFYRIFSVDFEPATELQITSIPRKLKVSYDFGGSAGVATKISFTALGGSLSEIVQSFIIDPLPDHMSFDLTVLGERSFKYESDRSYSVTYLMDSVQNGNLVKLALHDLPTRMNVEWGLNINLVAKSASGFVDLDMSSNIGEVLLYLYGSEKPFIQVVDFPKKLRLEGYIDIPNLKGYVSASKYSGSETTISVPITFDKWEITDTLKIKDGYVKLSWDLPSSEDPHVELGLDTNNNTMLGMGLSVVDTESRVEVLYIEFDGIATDDLKISWDYDSGKITNFQWSGKITKLIDLYASVEYQGVSFDISGSWTLGKSGSFEIELNKEVDVTFVDIASDKFKLVGSISLYADRRLKIDWEWGQTGHFTIYMPEPIGKEFYLEFGYNYSAEQQEYQYGFKTTATDLLWITKTIMWDTENGIIPRIWILGDEPLPGDWDVWLLWNYEWYEVK